MALVIRRIGANEFVPVSLEIYDAAGRYVQTVVDEVQSAGSHSMVWDTEELTSGVYFCRLNLNGASASQKLLLLR